MSWLLPSILALLLYGVWGFLPKLSAQYLDPKSAALYEVLGGIFVGVVLLIVLKFQPAYHPRGVLYAAGTGVCMLTGGLCYLYAARNGSLPVVVTLTALYPAITILLSYLVLGDAVTTKQMIGLACAAVSITLLTT